MTTPLRGGASAIWRGFCTSYSNYLLENSFGPWWKGPGRSRKGNNVTRFELSDRMALVRNPVDASIVRELQQRP